MNKLVQLWTKCKELIPINETASMDYPSDDTGQYIEQVIWTANDQSN